MISVACLIVTISGTYDTYSFRVTFAYWEINRKNDLFLEKTTLVPGAGVSLSGEVHAEERHGAICDVQPADTSLLLICFIFRIYSLAEIARMCGTFFFFLIFSK